MRTTARAIARSVREGADPVAVVAAAMDRVEADRLNTYRSWDRPAALAAAARVDRDAPLAGVPIALKDNLCDEGRPCGCASRILEGHRARYTATSVRRLRDAGAVVVARANMDEFAMGSSTENSAYGPTLHPLDTTRAPGGSSGGSAVSVATGITPVALGSETGGSVRQPAALCGVVGMKPTQGRVSRFGLVAFASSLDCVSPFGADVRDAALALRVIAGLDADDPTTLDAPVPDYLAACDRGARGLRIGLLAEASGEGVEPGVAARMAEVVRVLRAAGATVETVSIPLCTQALACYYVLNPAEASSNLARFDGLRYGLRVGADDLAGTWRGTRSAGFGPEVQRRILLGTFALSAGYADRYYGRAQAVRGALVAAFAEVFQRYDLVLTPTSATVAFRLGANATDPLAMYLCDLFTVPASLAGLPAISVPCGASDPDGSGLALPVGAQLVGRPLNEEAVFAVAAVLEESLPCS